MPLNLYIAFALQCDAYGASVARKYDAFGSFQMPLNMFNVFAWKCDAYGASVARKYDAFGASRCKAEPSNLSGSHSI
jgi:hypothetical protein